MTTAQSKAAADKAAADNGSTGPDEEAFQPTIDEAAFSALLGEVARDVKGVRPTGEGWTIAGRVTSVESITTDFGAVPATILDTQPNNPDAPLVRFAWMGTVLENQYERHQPKRGDFVAVRLVHKNTGKGVGDYDDWQVVVHKALVNEPEPSTAGRSRRVENREEPF